MRKLGPHCSEFGTMIPHYLTASVQKNVWAQGLKKLFEHIGFFLYSKNWGVLFIYCFYNNFKVLSTPPESMTQMYNKKLNKIEIIQFDIL